MSVVLKSYFDMVARMRCSSRATNCYLRLYLRFFAALGLISLFAISVSARTHSPITLNVLARDGYGVVPISRPRPNELIVRGTINGRNATLVLDTGWGAPGVSLDRNYAKSLKLTMAGPIGIGRSATGTAMPTQRAVPGSVVLGNVQLTGVPLAVGIFHSLRMHQAIMHGFVGVGFLHTNSAILDLPNFCLYLRPPGKGRLANLGSALKAIGLSEIPFIKSANGHCLVDAEANGVRGKMVIDTGATFSHLDSRFVQIKGKSSEPTLLEIDAAGVVNRRHSAQLASLRISGVPIRAPQLVIGTYSFYSGSGGKVVGVLGNDVLGQNWGIIDFGNQKLYLVKAK